MGAMVRQGIIKAFEYGFNVVVVCCDGAATNRSAMGKLFDSEYTDETDVVFKYMEHPIHWRPFFLCLIRLT